MLVKNAYLRGRVAIIYHYIHLDLYLQVAKSMDSKNNYKVIGLMSGTSLDGLDIACCQFTLTAKGWKYSITKATCLRYSPDWIKLLSSAHLLSGEQIVFLDHE